MARLLTALLGSPVAPAGAGRGRRTGGGAVRRGTGARTRARRGALRSALATPLSAARAGVAFVWMRRRLRLAALLALCLPALAVGGWMALRGSSLSAVEKVQISGAQGRQAALIEAALRRTARGMSTMHVQLGALRAAVARFPVVRDLRVSPSFPHGLRIRVIEQPPVAVLLAAGQRTAVAADGVVLGPELVAATLPSVRLAGVSPLTGHSVMDATTRAELSILGAAPPTLLGWVQSIASGSEGVVAAMRGGVQIYFGDAAHARAKWLAAARVLADSTSAGATYIDVRVPGRPVAGTSALGGLSSASATSAGAATSATSLAARLDEAVAGGSAGAAAAAATSPAAGAGEQTSSAGEPGGSGTSEAGSGAAGAGGSGSGGSSAGGTGSTEAAAGGSLGGASTGESSGGAAAGEAVPSGAAGSAGSAAGTAGSGGTAESTTGSAGGATGETPGSAGAGATDGGAAAGGG